MNVARRLSVACVALLIASCIPVRTNLQEIPLPPQRITEKGYSLVPPNEPGWIIAGRDQHRLALAKKGEGPDETFAIQTMLVRLPTFTSSDDLVRYLKDGQTKDTDPRRFKVLLHDVVPQHHRGIDCASSHFVVEDTAAVKRTTRAGDMILEALSLTCPHPKEKTVGVNVTYSHRYYQEQKDPAFREKAMHLMDTMEFDNP